MLYISLYFLLCNGGMIRDTDRKYLEINVRYWDKILEEPVTRFLSVPVCNIATGQSLCDAIDEAFTSCNIPWDNMIGYASDTASVMVGSLIQS